MSPWSLILSMLRLEWRRCVVVAALLFTGIGAQLGLPQVLARFLDSTIAGATSGALIELAVLYIALALAGQAVAVARTYVGAQLAWRGTNRIRSQLARHCLSLDLSFHKNHTAGELLERIDGDVSSLANLLSQFFVRVIGYFLLLTGILILLFAIHWTIGILALSTGILTFVSLCALQPHATRSWTTARQSRAELSSFFEEYLSATEDFRSCGRESFVRRQLRGALDALRRGYRGALVADNNTFTVVTGAFFAAYTASLGVSADLFLADSISIGAMYLVHHYYTLMYGPLQELQGEIRDLQQAYASLLRVSMLLSTQSRVPDEGVSSVPNGALAVALERVSFAYDEHQESILEDINLRIPCGRRLGIVGRTGSGKSTLVRLLCRLHDVSQGTILLSGVDIKEIPLHSLRQRVALVTQDVQLFAGTVRENITLFDSDVEDRVIMDALAALGLEKWIAELADGLDTRIGVGGEGLSAGEGQLIALARVFLKDPGLVILDEPSARLDPETEARVVRASHELLAHRTGIVIAHRLHTLAEVDDILILEDGHVAEYGPRDQLANDTASHFARLLRTGGKDIL